MLNGLTQLREIDGGSNYLGHDETIAHFGLGDLQNAVISELKISIPKQDGSGMYFEYVFADLAPNQRYTLDQKTGRLLSAVPEPATGLLGMLACGCAVVNRRRRP